MVAASSPTMTRGLSDQESSSRPRVGGGTWDPGAGPARAGPAAAVRPASAIAPAATTRRPSLRDRPTISAYACGFGPSRRAEPGDPGDDHGRAQAEGEGDGGPGRERAEAGGDLGAPEGRQVGHGPGQGQEHPAEQQVEQAGVALPRSSR